MTTFEHQAKAAGFSDEQIAFMTEWLAQTGHRHDIEEIDGLEQALALDEDEDEEEEDEEE